MQSVIDYKEISCVATDEDGKSYTMTYPEFKDESFAIKTLNKELKSKYEEASKKIEYHEDEELNKLKIYSINEILI